MRVQTLPMPDHDNHCLDAMVEYGELDVGSYYVLVLYADRDKVSSILYNEDDGSGRRSRISKSMMELADDIVNQLPVHKQGYLIFASFVHFIRTLKNLALICSDWALTDQCEGGAMNPFKRSYRHKADYRIPKRAKRRLHSRKWIKRYVRTNKDVHALRTVLETILSRMSAIPQGYVCDNKEEELLIYEAIGNQLEKSRLVSSLLEKRKDQAKRKMLLRSLRAAESLVPQNTLKAFISGDVVSITGKNLVLKVTRTGSLYSLGHGAFTVSVYDLDSTFLARLCVYFDKTPALDQLIGMMLYVSSGCEDEFIKSANVTQLSEAGRNHSLFKSIPKSLDSIELRHRAAIDIPYKVLHDRSESYWQATKNIWIHELGQFLLGRSCGDYLKHMYE